MIRLYLIDNNNNNNNDCNNVFEIHMYDFSRIASIGGSNEICKKYVTKKYKEELFLI